MAHLVAHRIGCHCEPQWTGHHRGVRTLGTRSLVNALVLTAMLSGACHVRGTDEATEPDVAEQPDASGDVSSTTTAAGTPPATEPSASQPSGDDDSTRSTSSEPAGAPEHAADAQQSATSEPPAGHEQSDPQGTDIEGQGADEEDRGSNLVVAEVTDLDWLPAGLETIFRYTYPEGAFALHPEAAQGDLDGDGDDDAVLHVAARSAGSPQPHLLVPVIDTGEAFEVQPPVELGSRIIIDTIDVRDGAIEVSLFDRSPGEPESLITRRSTLSVSPDGAEAAGWDVTVTRVEPIDTVPALHITRPATAAAIAPDGLGTAISDRIGLRERHPYIVQASEGEVVVATLDAPSGVWLEARLDDDMVLVPIAERTQRFASRIPADGPWSITVVSSRIEPADYRLSIDVFAAELSDRIATRDPAGFWSGTHISPPALPDEGSVVYLTFDDGPHPTYTPQILDVLARHGAKATFFVVGYFVERYPLIVQRIAHEGHTLANHSWDHHSLARVSRAAFDRSVERTQEILGPLATPCLRPPYYDLGRFTEEWSNELGLRLVGWTYSPRDWEQPPAKTIADGLVARSSPGAVLLLHDGGGPRSATVRGLDMALERLSDSGLEFKPLCR